MQSVLADYQGRSQAIRQVGSLCTKGGPSFLLYSMVMH